MISCKKETPRQLKEMKIWHKEPRNKEKRTLVCTSRIQQQGREITQWQKRTEDTKQIHQPPYGEEEGEEESHGACLPTGYWIYRGGESSALH